MKRILKIVGIAVGIYIVILGFSFIDWGFLRGEITEYPIQCNEIIAPNVCKNIEFAQRKTTYKVDYDKQKVFYQTEGFSVEELSDCAIRDRKNWSCKYPDGSAQLGFTDGKFWVIDTPPDPILKEDHIQYVNKASWISQSCHDSWIPYLPCLIVLDRMNG